MLRYGVVLTPDDNKTLQVTVPDVPGVNTAGDSEAEALANAGEALLTMLSFFIDERMSIPAAKPLKRGMKPLTLPALPEAKIELYSAMRNAGVSKSELARRLKIHLPQVDRLLDLRHASRLDQLESAFAALGKRLEVAIKDAA
jgi:antitoxin HicB